MDYHFVTPKTSEKRSSGKGDLRKLLKIIRQFLPVFLLAAILPVMIAFVSAPPDVRFLTRADTDPLLRVWIEPAVNIMKVSGETDLTVFAQFESETKLVPELIVNLSASAPVSLSESVVAYRKPFRGKVEVSRITASSSDAGEFLIDIPVSGISITAYDGPIEIKTSPVRLIVK